MKLEFICKDIISKYNSGFYKLEFLFKKYLNYLSINNIYFNEFKNCIREFLVNNENFYIYIEGFLACNKKDIVIWFLELYDIYEENTTSVLIDQFGWLNSDIDFLKNELENKNLAYLVDNINLNKNSPLLVFSNYDKLAYNYYKYKESKIEIQNSKNVKSYQNQDKTINLKSNTKKLRYEVDNEIIEILKSKKFWGKIELNSILLSRGIVTAIDKFILSKAGYKEMTAYFINKKWTVVEEIEFIIKGLRNDVIWDIQELFSEDLVNSIKYHIKNVDSIERISSNLFIIKSNLYMTGLLNKVKEIFINDLKKGIFIWKDFYKHFNQNEIPNWFYESISFNYLLNKYIKDDKTISDFSIYNVGDKWIILNNKEHISLISYFVERWALFKNNIPLPMSNDLDEFINLLEKEFNVVFTHNEKEDIISTIIYQEQKWI